MYMSVRYVHVVPTASRRGCWNPLELDIQMVVRNHTGCREWNLDPGQEQPVVLTDELSTSISLPIFLLFFVYEI